MTASCRQDYTMFYAMLPCNVCTCDYVAHQNLCRKESEQSIMISCCHYRPWSIISLASAHFKLFERGVDALLGISIHHAIRYQQHRHLMSAWSHWTSCWHPRSSLGKFAQGLHNMIPTSHIDIVNHKVFDKFVSYLSPEIIAKEAATSRCYHIGCGVAWCIPTTFCC